MSARGESAVPTLGQPAPVRRRYFIHQWHPPRVVVPVERRERDAVLGLQQVGDDGVSPAH